jgi:hypothetical protein
MMANFGRRKEANNVYVTELSSQTNSITDAKDAKSNSPRDEEAFPAPWPTQPRVLGESNLSRKLNLVFDVALMVAPILLILKIALVILVSRSDQYASNTLANPPTPETRYLIRFNAQVRSIASDYIRTHFRDTVN